MDVTTDRTSVYWTDWFRGEVYEADKATGVRRVLATAQSFAFRSPIVTDDEYVYWATEDPRGGLMTGAVRRRAKRGDHDPVLLLRDLLPVGALAVDDDHLYLTLPLAGIVARARKDGSNLESIVEGVDRPIGLAIDEARVYWSSLTEGTVTASEKDGSGPEVLAQELSRPIALAIDRSHLFAASKSEHGEIVRIPKHGGASAVLAAQQQLPGHLAVDDIHVYWTTVGGVWCAAKTATVERPAPSGESAAPDPFPGVHGVTRIAGFSRVPDPTRPQDLDHAPAGIAVDDVSVYWVDVGELGGLFGGPKNPAPTLT
jgi:hypothetical protein